MSLRGIAQENEGILKQGFYTSPTGSRVDLSSPQQAAVQSTQLFTPEQGLALLQSTSRSPTEGSSWPAIAITDEKVQVAARRLVSEEQQRDLVVLNFASARNPGGGYVRGAKAQEEDIARCSGVYPCLLKQPTYYEANRQQSSLLYTDHVIYSPNVPWFRDEHFDLLDSIYLASIITAPAPNAGQELRLRPKAMPAIQETLHRRAGIILAIAHQHQHRSLLLGAWGCGVFQNSPYMVAEAFRSWLFHPRFAGCFSHVTFAIFCTKARHNEIAFREVFSE